MEALCADTEAIFAQHRLAVWIGRALVVGGAGGWAGTHREVVDQAITIIVDAVALLRFGGLYGDAGLLPLLRCYILLTAPQAVATRAMRALDGAGGFVGYKVVDLTVAIVVFAVADLGSGGRGFAGGYALFALEGALRAGALLASNLARALG